MQFSLVTVFKLKATKQPPLDIIIQKSISERRFSTVAITHTSQPITRHQTITVETLNHITLTSSQLASHLFSKSVQLQSHIYANFVIDKFLQADPW